MGIYPSILDPLNLKIFYTGKGKLTRYICRLSIYRSYIKLVLPAVTMETVLISNFVYLYLVNHYFYKYNKTYATFNLTITLLFVINSFNLLYT